MLDRIKKAGEDRNNEFSVLSDRVGKVIHLDMVDFDICPRDLFDRRQCLLIDYAVRRAQAKAKSIERLRKWKSTVKSALAEWSVGRLVLGLFRCHLE
jgi:hypothetical protein